MWLQQVISASYPFLNNILHSFSFFFFFFPSHILLYFFNKVTELIRNQITIKKNRFISELPPVYKQDSLKSQKFNLGIWEGLLGDAGVIRRFRRPYQFL